MKKIYRKSLLVFLVCIVSVHAATAQITISLQPGGSQSKDAYIDSWYSYSNYGDHFDFAAISWTNMGYPADARGLIDFDLSAIPDSAEIASAILYLYSYNSPANGSHYPLTHSNTSVLQRIVTPWHKNLVNWSNQPTSTTQNQVIVPQSTTSIQDYELTVTAMVQDMVNDPDNSHGFLLKLIDEEIYTRLVFASGDHADPSLHPKLIVTYKEDVDSVSEQVNNEMNLNIYPNPTSDYITIDLSHMERDPVSIKLVNILGQKILHRTDGESDEIILDVSAYAKGVYFIKIDFSEFVVTKKMVIG